MIHAMVYSLIALWLLTDSGNRLSRLIFALTGLKDATAAEPEPGHNAGRWIGAIERLLVAAAMLTARWEILAAVIALKTVARFRKLDEQLFAEYFLIGSLFSILWAILVTGAWLAYDHRVGVDLHQAIVGWAGQDGERHAAR